MRFGIALPNYGPLAAPETLVRLARLAEDEGVDSVWVSDHLVAPEGVRSVYPYDRRPDPKPGDMGVIEEFYEPMVTLAWLAGATSRVRLGISAYVMPYRNPVVTAKQVATLDRLSGGRVIFGIGVGWLAEEFAALGVPFERRGRRTEDYVGVCKALWTGETARFEGETYRLPPVRTGPRPRQLPHPPLWIAGNSARGIERAARIGDGWHGIDLSPDELRPLAARAREQAAAHGKAAFTVSIRKGVLPGGPAGHALYGDRDAIRRDLDAYRDAGLDYLVAGLRRATTSDDAARALEDVARALA
ncbi:MAG TPA: TIGR03619 family F420-dependent LLM class oxidoreductase [Candidatus Eisenbacteria bacterium]|nr:TIGR03619 family F420-dependent LLM class oxidoreductase [Candidatus Eisenbacteria bacterium]